MLRLGSGAAGGVGAFAGALAVTTPELPDEAEKMSSSAIVVAATGSGGRPKLVLFLSDAMLCTDASTVEVATSGDAGAFATDGGFFGFVDTKTGVA